MRPVNAFTFPLTAYQETIIIIIKRICINSKHCRPEKIGGISRS